MVDLGSWRLEPVRGGATESVLGRVRGTLADGARWCCIVKRMTAIEYAVHRLVCTMVPGAAPRLLASSAISADGSSADRIVLLEDVTSESRPRREVPAPFADPAIPENLPAADAATFRQALAVLARVHSRFITDTPRLEACGLRSVLALGDHRWVAVDDVCQTFTFLADTTDVAIDHRVVDELRRIASSLPYWVAMLQRANTRTLAHGDFHLANIAVDAAGTVRLMDWGASVIASPAWDLVTYGASEVEAYLAALGSSAAAFDRAAYDESFCRELRASVVVRMFALLRPALALWLDRGGAAAAAAVTVCADRLIEAASDVAFRGGRGVRLLQ